MCSYSKWKKLEKTKFASKNRGQFIKSFFIRIKEFTTLLPKILYLVISKDDNPNHFLSRRRSFNNLNVRYMFSNFSKRRCIYLSFCFLAVHYEISLINNPPYSVDLSQYYILICTHQMALSGYILRTAQTHVWIF